jgi:HAD superfamily hydrolase (TIGR01509 family)
VTRSALILDFDGTILDTEDSVYRVWSELWDEHGHQLLLADWQGNIGSEDHFDPWIELEARLGRRLDPARRRRCHTDQLRLVEGLEPRPGILPWLAEAEASGIEVGIASSSPLEWVGGHLDRLGLRDRFSCLVCVDDDVPAKPDPTSYRLACQRLGADPRASVAVEDSPHGLTAARTAGLFTVATPHGLTAGLDLSAAHLITDSLDRLTLSVTLALARERSAPEGDQEPVLG